MKVMFVENRQQTQFWEAVAVGLQEDGHRICWMVQNAKFLPAVGKSYLIPYPNREETRLSIVGDAELQRILSSDRNINYFGGDCSHYSHYDAEICSILDAAQPDVVFGEATLFHEQLCIKCCRERDILYLQPTSCRYPPRRFSFYRYCTQEPIHGSGQVFDEPLAREIVSCIARRELVPNYVKRETHKGVFGARLRRFRNGLGIAASYVAGEHYNTPSPTSKLFLEARSLMNKFRWERLASRAPAAERKFRILYPLQMQPESNIDVWGNDYREQATLIASLLRATEDDTVIVVKPNPNSKYELSGELIDLVASSDRLVPVSQQANMRDVLEGVDLTVTVTGTVAIEANLTGRPVVTLVETLNNAVPSCIYLENLNGLGNVVRQVRERTFPTASEAEKLAFLNLLTRTSYRGLISNPYSTPTCLSDENLRDVGVAFRHVLGAIRSGREGLQARSDEAGMRTAQHADKN